MTGSATPFFDLPTPFFQAIDRPVENRRSGCGAAIYLAK
jgi:hypothetical protein